MVQWGWTCSDMWAEDAASSTVTCSLGQNVGRGMVGDLGGLGGRGEEEVPGLT